MKTQNEVELEFKQAFDSAHEQIQKKCMEASFALNEAVALSEQHGIPFRPQMKIMWCRPSYIPNSFKSKFPILNDYDNEEYASVHDALYDFWSGVTDAHGGGEYTGWQQSQVC